MRIEIDSPKAAEWNDNRFVVEEMNGERSGFLKLFIVDEDGGGKSVVVSVADMKKLGHFIESTARYSEVEW
jgi:hypothetical protein